MAKLVFSFIIWGMVFCGHIALAQPVASTYLSSETEFGVKCYAKGDYEGAIKSLKQALKKSNNDADAWHYLGLAFYRKGKDKDARKAFETEIKVRPDFYPARISLANLYFFANKLSEAESHANVAAALLPSRPEPHYLLGAIFLRQNNFAATQDHLTRGLQIDAKCAPLHVLKAQLLFRSHPKTG